MQRIGERIKAKRTQLGWTQDDLASKAGVSKGFLSDLERNNRRISAPKLLDIAGVLGLSLDYLMKGSSERDTQKDVEVPASLAEFARIEGLSFRTTLVLLDMQRQIVANRSPGGTADGLDAVNWREFFEAVEKFIQ